MKSCRRFQELAARRAAGLTEAEALTLEFHLGECESCRRDAAALDALGGLYRERGAATSERARRRAVSRAISEGRQRGEAVPLARRPGWLGPAVAVAAAAGLALAWFGGGAAFDDGAVVQQAKGDGPGRATPAPEAGEHVGDERAVPETEVAAEVATVASDRVLEGDIRVEGRAVAPGTRLAGIGLSSANGGEKVAGIGLSSANGGEKVAGIGLSSANGSEKVAGIGLSSADGGEKVAGIGLSSANGGEKVAGIGLSTVDGGAVALASATVVLEPRTSVRWRAAERIVALREGAVLASVDVAAGEPFRVATKRFVVEVVGTEFEVNERGVSVKEGVVRVLAPGSGQELATVKAGARWEVEDDDRAAAGAGAPSLVGPTERRRPTDVAAELDRARGELASGSPRAARRRLKKLLAADVVRRQRAEAETLVAECALVEGDQGQAGRLYLQVARRYGDLAAGETALFAAARAFDGAGETDRAAALYRRYARRYPRGRFISQVRERL